MNDEDRTFCLGLWFPFLSSCSVFKASFLASPLPLVLRPRAMCVPLNIQTDTLAPQQTTQTINHKSLNQSLHPPTTITQNHRPAPLTRKTEASSEKPTTASSTRQRALAAALLRRSVPRSAQASTTCICTRIFVGGGWRRSICLCMNNTRQTCGGEQTGGRFSLAPYTTYTKQHRYIYAAHLPPAPGPPPCRCSTPPYPQRRRAARWSSAPGCAGPRPPP